MKCWLQLPLPRRRSGSPGRRGCRLSLTCPVTGGGAVVILGRRATELHIKQGSIKVGENVRQPINILEIGFYTFNYLRIF